MVGNVVLTPLPFTDLSESKICPVALIADVGISDWIVCQITSRPSDQVLRIQITGDDMRVGSLRVVSYARPDRLFTLNESVFHRTLGSLSDAKMNEILTAARSLF